MDLENVTKEWLENEYQTKSFQQIAQELNTYTMKILRLAKKLGIQSKTHSEAQSNYLLTTDNHPTKGKRRSDETRNKISRIQTMNNLLESDEKKEQRRKRGRQTWDNFTDEQKKELTRAGIAGCHKAAKEGSRLEKFLVKQLSIAGYKVEQHREHFLPSGKMHLDIFLPELQTVIEVNGIAHYEPVWGPEILASTQLSDKTKQGLLLVAGYVFIEVADTSNRVSVAQMTNIWEQLKPILLKISSTHLRYDERYMLIKTKFNPS